MSRETRELVSIFGERLHKELAVDDTLPAPIAALLARLDKATRSATR